MYSLDNTDNVMDRVEDMVFAEHMDAEQESMFEEAAHFASELAEEIMLDK